MRESEQEISRSKMVYKLRNPLATLQCWKVSYDRLKEDSSYAESGEEDRREKEKHMKRNTDKRKSYSDRIFKSKSKCLDNRIEKLSPSPSEKIAYLETTRMQRFNDRRSAVYGDILIDDIKMLYSNIVEKNLRACNLV